MSKIVFFNLPGHGHVNPTIKLVRELIKNGHDIIYYCFDEFKNKIEATGAKYVSCDKYLPKKLFKKAMDVNPHILVIPNMIMKTTLNMQSKCLHELKKIKPDCIIYDSLALWGRLYAEKLGILHISSTTTFIFNKSMTKRIPISIKYLRDVVPQSIPSLPTYLKLKNQLSKNYNYNSLNDMILAKEDEKIITYTSELLQTYITPSPNIKFVGTMIDWPDIVKQKNRFPKKIYISLGTVNNQNIIFYKNCFKALQNYNAQIIMSVGKSTDINSLGQIPSNFTVKNFVDQVEVLKTIDIFLTHGGMNSVNEALAHGLPLIVHPQQPEQTLVATQVENFGAGIHLKEPSINNILASVNQVLINKKYAIRAALIAKEFRALGGSKSAVQFIEEVINSN
ncbi:hypothetical protein AN639_11165 [Candidatus Epulonipiscium fishelsonii]|uniref:Uncharacterized protein n=1 Tax=Candidatus Epulonipiscium fishelsonii TaxID=77094 RepID=A0ACC8X8W8_9FIRM|nr:hypothetical protein AN396_10385 [Epulopiscium sp. SCG-B11WGA-EpuloA1]ONI43150.1 hypothetical protein AN639_11165 [Epulopiscium sp. SCG-B05WGA-EpuloA1]